MNNEWIKFKNLPAKVQFMLNRVNSVIKISTHNTINYREDAVFVKFNHIDLYALARLVTHSPDINFELRSKSQYHIILSCSCSDWQIEHETNHKLPYVSKPIQEQQLLEEHGFRIEDEEEIPSQSHKTETVHLHKMEKPEKRYDSIPPEHQPGTVSNALLFPYKG